MNSFDIPYINSQPIPKVPKNLLPWIIKDRKEAVEGVYIKNQKGEMIHDGSGLDKAEQSLRQAQNLQKEKHTDSKVIDFLNSQVIMAEDKVRFYKGKIYILDQIIKNTH